MFLGVVLADSDGPIRYEPKAVVQKKWHTDHTLLAKIRAGGGASSRKQQQLFSALKKPEHMSEHDYSASEYQYAVTDDESPEPVRET